VVKNGKKVERADKREEAVHPTFRWEESSKTKEKLASTDEYDITRLMTTR